MLAGEVGERLNTLFDDARFVGGQLKHVDRFVKGGVGVDVRPHACPRRFQRGNELPRLVALRAVEGHVLEEMRQALLIVRLIDRTRLDHEPENDPLLRPAVLADVVSEAIRQRSGRDRAVERQPIGRGKRFRDRRGGLRGNQAGIHREQHGQGQYRIGAGAYVALYSRAGILRG